MLTAISLSVHPCSYVDDHSRVKLAQLADKDGKVTDYINANYVDVSTFAIENLYGQTGPWQSLKEDLSGQKQRCKMLTIFILLY